jgi:hypothetical protein
VLANPAAAGVENQKSAMNTHEPNDRTEMPRSVKGLLLAAPFTACFAVATVVFMFHDHPPGGRRTEDEVALYQVSFFCCCPGVFLAIPALAGAAMTVGALIRQPKDRVAQLCFLLLLATWATLGTLAALFTR